jgi:hypothetical protein
MGTGSRGGKGTGFTGWGLGRVRRVVFFVVEVVLVVEVFCVVEVEEF